MVMVRLTTSLPKEKLVVACSGGVDSVAAAAWLAASKHVFGLQYVNHGTPYADAAEDVVRELARNLGVNFSTTRPCPKPPSGYSREEFWRNYRYSIFHVIDKPVVTAHTLDDCLEELIMSSFVRGRYSVIPYRNKNVIRPFRLSKKQDLAAYVDRKGLNHIEDPSNDCIEFQRNYIRHKIVPNIKTLNPGVFKVVRRAVLQQDNRDNKRDLNSGLVQELISEVSNNI